MDFMLNAGGTTCNYDTNLYRNVQHKLWTNKRDIERPIPKTCFRNACRSGAGHWRAPLPQSLCQTNPYSGPKNSVSKDLIAASEDLLQKRLQIWGRSLASASPSEPLPNQPKLRANKLDIERPASCSGRPAAETPADLVQVTGELF